MKFKLLTVFLLFLFVTSCAPKHAVKQEELPAPPPPVEEITPPATGQKKVIQEEKKPVVEKKAEEQYVMLNFENADIGTVINTISEMLKINYILAPGVAGKITIQSQNKVPLSELFTTFQTILEFNGFTAVKEGSFYRIVPIDTAKQQPVKMDAGKTPEMPKDASFITQQIPLEYVKASDVANLVRNLMPRGTDIIVYEPSNMLIITAPPSGMVKMMKLLEAIDIPSTERDSVKTFVYMVENGEAKSLAGILKGIYGKQKAGDSKVVKATAPTAAPTTPQAMSRRPTPTPTAPPATAATSGATVLEGLEGDIEGEVVFDSYDDINALIIKSTPRSYLALLETIKKLDIQPKQVLIEVLIAEVKLDDTMDMGLEWVLKTSLHAEGQDYDVRAGYSGNPLPYFNDDLTGFVPVVSGGIFANVIDPKRFNVLINAVATDGNVKVLASPHILALDNKEAKIEIADEVPVASSISQPQTGTDNIYSQIQFKSVGTILTVTPQINEKKQVTLKINQEVSEIGGTVKIADQDYTGFTTRKANTTAIVQDGHTLVIGGIIKETTNNTRTGIPYLSKIPILGYLFGSTKDKTSRTELLLMVTPHVVGTHDEADALTEEYTNKVKGLKKRIAESTKKLPGEKDEATQADIHLHATPEESKIEEDPKQQKDKTMIINNGLIIK